MDVMLHDQKINNLIKMACSLAEWVAFLQSICVVFTAQPEIPWVSGYIKINAYTK